MNLGKKLTERECARWVRKREKGTKSDTLLLGEEEEILTEFVVLSLFPVSLRIFYLQFLEDFKSFWPLSLKLEDRVIGAPYVFIVSLWNFKDSDLVKEKRGEKRKHNPNRASKVGKLDYRAANSGKCMRTRFREWN